MGINTTMYNGLSGVGRFSDNMSVLADNIANLNTIAYKSSRAVFEEIVRDASDRFASGAGVEFNTISGNFTPTGFQSTNVPSDMAISGNGFKTLTEGQTVSYPPLSTAGTASLA